MLDEFDSGKTLHDFNAKAKEAYERMLERRVARLKADIARA